LHTDYMGLKLRNPLIVSSSSLTNSVAKIKKIEQAGAGAVVLKSLFEEQVAYETNSLSKGIHNDYPEAYDYIKNYTLNSSVSDYIALIKEVKAAVSIPVIASIHCYSSSEWVSFARRFEEAGADALELNVYVLDTQKYADCQSIEAKYIQIVQEVSKAIKIPVSVKIGQQITGMVSFVKNLYAAGAKGVVLFNRFFSPDIDIEKLAITSSNVLSSPNDYVASLRWTAIVSGKLDKMEISASTGIHVGATAVKFLLAGARTFQVCSAVYLHGEDVIKHILDDLSKWMERKGYESINDFRGLLNYSEIVDPAVYERTQFMKHFASGE